MSGMVVSPFNKIFVYGSINHLNGSIIGEAVKFDSYRNLHLNVFKMFQIVKTDLILVNTMSIFVFGAILSNSDQEIQLNGTICKRACKLWWKL